MVSIKPGHNQGGNGMGGKYKIIIRIYYGAYLGGRIIKISLFKGPDVNVPTDI